MSSKLVEEIGKMSVMELADLIKEIEDKFGVSAAAPVAAVAASAGGDAPAAAEAKSEFKVTLKDIGSEKIKVIKALRSVTQLNLGDAKKAVESAPHVVAESASKEDADKMKKALEEAGASVELS